MKELLEMLSQVSPEKAEKIALITLGMALMAEHKQPPEEENNETA